MSQSPIDRLVAEMKAELPPTVETTTLIDAAAVMGNWEDLDDYSRVIRSTLTNLVAALIGKADSRGLVVNLLERRNGEIREERRLAEEDRRIAALRVALTDLGSFPDDTLRTLVRKGVDVNPQGVEDN